MADAPWGNKWLAVFVSYTILSASVFGRKGRTMDHPVWAGRNNRDVKPHIAQHRVPASFVAPTHSSRGLPGGYMKTLMALKERIAGERLRTVLAANAGMVLLYWDVGCIILDRQRAEGWGSKVIDRLSADLRLGFPDMKGLSPRNLKYMRAFAGAWPDRTIVQEALAQITWYHNIALLEQVRDPATRLWYAAKVREMGWSRHVLCLQIERRAHRRLGKAVHNFPATLPPKDSDLAAQIFKDPYLFDFLGTADPRR